MPIKKIEIHGLNPDHPVSTVIEEINNNLDNILEHINGIDAETGVVGPTGAKGDKGDRGEIGPQGEQGLPGKDGKDGVDGQQGPAGKDGKDGQDGQPGRDGLPGRDGVNGKDGKDGLPGAQGPKGETGAQGIQGLPGKDGKDGLPGTAGRDGLPGAAGPQGVAGPVGPQGLKGDKGDPGAQGIQGLKGDKGDTGAIGPVGTPGAMNTVTYTGPVVTVNALGQTIAQTTFTSNGFPIVCIANGDANPDASRWIQIQWYKDGVAIGNKFHMESSGGNINCHYNVITPDTPTTGTHTYSLRTVGNMSGSWTFGEGGGPQLTFIELSGATGPAGKDAVSGTNLNVSYLTVAAQGGDEGGEIQLNKPATNTSIAGTGVVMDVFQNKLRIFEQGGTNRGAYLDLSSTGAGVGTNLARGFASGYVDAGQFVTLDNLKFTVTTSGQRGLSCATVSGTATLAISAHYAMIGGVAGTATNWSSMPTYNSTTPSSSWFGWSFPNAGDTSTYNIQDVNTKNFYRVTLMIGPGYTKNFISIERLY